MELSSIYIYPVKSLRGFLVDRARTEQGGVVGDRMWIVLDERGSFMHQRDYPRMATISAEYDSSALVLQAPGMRPLEVPVSPGDSRDERGTPQYVQLWRRASPVVPTTPDADAWISQAIGHRARLMALTRAAPARNVPDYELNSTLQDATPFHLTSESSLADLNARSSVHVPMNRFRPNVVVSGAEPYAEDRWKRIQIGPIRLAWVKPCTRCVTTMTDQVTGERERREPLYTLSTYRRWRGEVVFGHYFDSEPVSATIQVGDSIDVLESH